MEQLNPFFDEGATENFFNLDQLNQGMSQIEKSQLMQKLLSTIDINRLSELYFQQVKSHLMAFGLKIQLEDNTLTLGDWPAQSKQKTLSCQINGQTIATLHYCFNRLLGARDWLVLQQMHMYFCNPLKNALEHYKIKQFAMKDYLTSLGNRASYTESVARLMSQAERHQMPFGLLVIDLDNFKQVNDKFGHHEGDKVLMCVAQTIRHCLRESDLAFRFGGDEFCCLLPTTPRPTMQFIAERICQAIASDENLAKYQISCSIGSTAYISQDTADSVFTRADAALYLAKNDGRNCIKAA